MKRAVVLAGGGAKGSYQIGFWRAIRELGIDFQIVTGSSVGALNAALMASGSFDDAMDMWTSITTSDIINTSPTKISQLIDTEVLAASLKGIIGDMGENALNLKMDPFPLSGIIDRFLSEDAIRKNNIEYGIMTTEYPILRPAPFMLKDIPNGSLKDYLLASSAVYPSMEPKKIGEKRYIDGGYSDNLPVNLALDMGANDIIAVELHAPGVEAKYQSDYPIRLIQPYFDLGPSMKFSPETAKRNIALGYNDTMRSFGMLDGSFYTFKSGERDIFDSLYTGAFVGRLADIGSIRANEVQNFCKTTIVKLFSDTKKVRAGTMRYSLPMVAAETAADIFEIEPTEVYEHKEFGAKVLAAFKEYDKSGAEKIEALFDAQKPLNYLLGQLKTFNKKDMTSFIAKKWLANERFFDRDMRALGRMFPAEYFAALYISLLKGETRQ